MLCIHKEDYYIIRLVCVTLVSVLPNHYSLCLCTYDSCTTMDSVMIVKRFYQNNRWLGISLAANT